MGSDESADLASRFLQSACLTYDGVVGPAEWAGAGELLADHPQIGEGNVYVAAVAADGAALSRVLHSDPAAARQPGGPHRWEPLIYLTYARHDPSLSEDAVLTAARLLLDAGADPNAGFTFDGQSTPFTVLTGVFGEGELGPAAQPRHPYSLALGRLLLESGADPNDGQALYNRMFGADDDHLELLFEFGLGTGDGGPWRRRSSDALESPTALVRGQLAWAVVHGMDDRVRLLADHGVDLAAPFTEASARLLSAWVTLDGDEPTPVVLAALSGHPETVRLLVGSGAPTPTLSPAAEFVSAALAADRVTVNRLAADHPAVLDHVIASRPGLLPWAGAAGRAGAVALLVELGFDVNARGRSDVPSNQPWHTALHAAVEHNDLDLARTLLRLGADPDSRDVRFKATPLGWAQYFDRPALIDLLEPVTTPPPPEEQRR